MAYTPLTWVTNETAVSAANMNHIEQGLANAHEMLEPDSLAASLLNYFHPVGMYFETSDTTFNPNTAWGGTWVLEAEGLVHVSSGTNYPVSSNTQDGGVSEVTLTAAQSGTQEQEITTESAGAHTHAYAYANRSKFEESGSGTSHYQHSGYSSVATTSAGAHTHSLTVAEKDALEAHTNMMPHKNINRWHRTA